MSPRTAQSLARHSDIRLTMGVCTHIGLCDQTTAIESLPGPPPFESKGDEAAELRATGTDGRIGRVTADDDQLVPPVVPSGAEIGAIRLASDTNDSASTCTQVALENQDGEAKSRRRKPATNGELCAYLHRDALLCIAITPPEDVVRPTGFEPVTLGSEDRCAIQLRHGRESCYFACFPAFSASSFRCRRGVFHTGCVFS